MAYGKPFTDDWTKKHQPRLMLRSCRKAMNLSIRDLASKAHWSPSYIGEAEKGTCEMSIRMAQSLAKVLMVNNWYDLTEKFRYEEHNGKCKFIGDNGTVIEIANIEDRNEMLSE